MTSNQSIIDYYDNCEVHYRTHWNLDQSLSLHYGYWDETTDSFHKALINTNKKLASLANIQPHHDVIDMGCGIGGSSIYLSNSIRCKCTGITLSEKQVASANGLADQFNLTDKCTFEVKDFTHTGYADASFDIVWAVESACHANDKAAFLQEAFRLLKPGGKLVLADFFQTSDNLNPSDQRILDNWAAGWAVPFYETKKRFLDAANDIGFRLTYYEDASQNVKPSAKRLYYRFFPGWIYAKLYRLFNPNSAAIALQNVWTAYYQYVGLKRHLWEYGILVAEK